MTEPTERSDQSPFSRLVGPVDVSWHPMPIFRAEVRADCANSRGRAHGGFVVSLVDIAAGQGVKRILADGRALVTVSTNVDYLGPARVGEVLDLTVSAVHDTTSMVFASCSVSVGERPVAIASVVFSARQA